MLPSSQLFRSLDIARWRRVAVATAFAALAVGCGSDDSTTEETPSTEAPAVADAADTSEAPDVTEPGEEAGDAVDAAFPVTIEHMNGSVTIEEKPQRIVTVGYADTDIANALGVEIVASVASPFGDDGLNPVWATTDLGADVAVLSAAEPNLEAIAAARPDIILATGSYPSYIAEYDALSEIAPVIAPLTGPLLDSADDITAAIGTALGETEAAEALLAETAASLEAFRTDHPELDGLTAVFAPREGEQTAIFVEPTAASVGLLAELGLDAPTELVELPGDRIFGATFISDEQIELLDTADIAIVGIYNDASREVFFGLPTVGVLDVVANDALIEIDQRLGAALQSPNPVSIQYVLDELGPQLVAAAS